jgi:hypothetical protein
MVRNLHRDSEAERRGRALIMWCPVTVIVRRRSDVDVLAYAVERGWIALSPEGRSMRVTAEGRRAIIAKGE